MKKYFLLLAVVAGMVDGQAQNLLSDCWNKAAFIGSVPEALEVKTAPQALSMLVKSDVPKEAPPKRIYSLWQELPPCDMNGVLLLKFEARQTASQQFYLICVAGASPGNCPPNTHSVIYPTDIWKEFEVQMPLSGLNNKSVIEFIWEGVMKKGDKIEIRNIRLVEDESKSSARFSIQRPVNLVLDPANPLQRFSSEIYPLRSQVGGSYVMKIADASNAEKTLMKVSGKLSASAVPWSIDASGFPEGEYLLSLEIVSQEGKKVGPLTRNVWKSALSDAVFTVRNNTVYKNGKPFIPIGIYHAGMWNIDRANEISRKVGSRIVTYDEAYADIAAHGFNAVHTATRPDSSDINPVAEALDRHGLMLIPEIRDGRNFTIPRNLMGWYGADEASSGLAQQQGRKIYADVKNFKMNYPVYAANYIKTITSDILKNGCMFDVLLFDHYVIRSAKTDFTELGQEMQSLKKDIANVPELVFGYVPQAFVYNGPEPTPAQLRLQIYLAIINNVRAFVYYSYNEDYDHRTDFTARKGEFPELPDGMTKNPKRKNWWIVDSILWDEVGKLNREISALSDFILHDGTPLKITCSAQGVQFAAREVRDKKYLIAVNLKPEPVDALFRFPTAMRLKERFGTGALDVKRGGNVLRFAPYEAKVFIGE